MTIAFDAKNAAADKAETSTSSSRRTPPEKEWRQFDFGMDCLIPAEDYSLPKEMKRDD